MPRPVLVTAGATRNPIDRMRHISAYSSGRTGLGLALRLAARHSVHLLGHPEVEARAAGRLPVEVFGSTRDLMERMGRWVRAHRDGIVLHTAAVGDYEAEEPVQGKVESGRQRWVVPLKPAPKIADHLRDWGPGILLVTFKAAPPEIRGEALVEVARAQLERTRSDLVFANTIGSLDRDVLLLTREGPRWFARREEGLQALLDWIEEHEARRGA